MDLKELRAELDKVDREIVSLYERRMELCDLVARDKIKTGKAVLDTSREAQKLESVAALVEKDFDKKAVQELYRQLMTVSRRLQLGILKEEGLSISSIPFEKTGAIEKHGKTVIFQGVQGAYAELAAKKSFPEDCRFQSVKTWREGMELVERGEADYMVLPIENSSHGAVYDNLDLLLDFPELVIQEEIDIPIEHALLACPGTDISDLRKVYSHPQALGQCQSFFREHPEIEAVPVLNTAVAAKLVSESGDPSLGALASEASGELYHLDILKKSVNQQKSNTTRFLILGREKIYQEGAGKVSMVFEAVHHPGALYNILGNFLFNDVNMRMIQSRPVPDQPFEYRFYVDIEGNLSEENVINALNGIIQETTSFRILGCF